MPRRLFWYSDKEFYDFLREVDWFFIIHEIFCPFPDITTA